MLMIIEHHNSENDTINYFLDSLDEFCHLDRLGTDLDLFKESPKAKKMLKIINQEGFDYLWISNFFKPFILHNPYYYV